MKQSYNFAEKRNLFAAALGLVAALATPAAQAQIVSSTPKLEAENAAVATLSGGAVVATTIAGASGAGYVDYNGEPSGVAFKFNAPAAGFYDLVIRYESQYDFKQGDLVVNGGTASVLYFNSTKTGAAFRSTTPRRILLNAGDNIVSIQAGYNYYGIDYIQIAPSAPTVTALTPAATTGRVEAEAGLLYGVQSLVKDGDATTHSGSLYVSSFSDIKTAGSSITLPVTIATAGLYQIAVGARGQFADKQFDLAVTTGTSTGGKLTTSLGAASTDFKSYPVGKYNLTAGTNTITITSQTGYLDIDYVDVTATTGVATAAKAGAADQLALSAYPNPTNGQALRVSLEATAAQPATFDLVNALGQRVLSTSRSLKAGSNQFQLTTERLGSGIYQLIVRRGDQPLLVKRVVLN